MVYTYICVHVPMVVHDIYIYVYTYMPVYMHMHTRMVCVVSYVMTPQGQTVNKPVNILAYLSP